MILNANISISHKDLLILGDMKRNPLKGIVKVIGSVLRESIHPYKSTLNQESYHGNYFDYLRGDLRQEIVLKSEY